MTTPIHAQERELMAERKLYLAHFPAYMPGYWTERQEQEFAVWQAARAALQAVPAPSVALDGLHVSAKARLELAQAAQPVEAIDLRADIMKLPCDSGSADLWDRSDKELRAYRIGHRDARHAAAELVSAYKHDAQPVQKSSTPEADKMDRISERMEAKRQADAMQPVQSIDTADERAAFEARNIGLRLDRFEDDEYMSTRVEAMWIGWKDRAHIAQRAASGEGTPVLPVHERDQRAASVDVEQNLVGMEVSMDVSTSEDDAGNRIFGRVAETMEGAGGGFVILAVEESRNFAAPAPIADEVAGDDEVGAMAYRGNTVSYMYDRAKAYGNIISECCALIGGTGDIRDRIRLLLEAKASAPDAPAGDLPPGAEEVAFDWTRDGMVPAENGAYLARPPIWRMAAPIAAEPAPAASAQSGETVRIRLLSHGDSLTRGKKGKADE